jgi:hypothetical protein
MARKVIGPTGSRRRRWLFPLCLIVALGAAAFFIAGAGAVTGSPSGFESGDGNMVLNDTSSGTSTDWNCFVGQPGFQSGTPNAQCAVTSGATQTWADGGTTSVGSNELEFKGGTKFDDECPVVQGGNNPPKDEWSNIAEYTEAASNHDLWFYGASIRPVVNGNSSGNVYFNQGTNPNGAGCHTVGDILLAFDFLNGGGTPALHSLTWISSGSCYIKQSAPPCWGNEQEISGSDYDGNVNTSAISGSANGISGVDLPANAFAEFGINLTQAIKDGGGTAPPCFASQTWVSRSSGSSFTSQPEDVENVSRPTCGTITIVKHTQNGSGTRPSPGIDQDFSYSDTDGLSPDSFKLNDKAGCDPSTTCTTATNTETFSNVPAGSYTVTEGANPDNFTFVSLSCTHSGTGTTAAPDSTVEKQANITLGISGSVVCTYTNKQQLGAILITKTGKDKNCESSSTSITNGKCTGAGTANLGGATFSVTSGGTAITGSPFTTSNGTGAVCIDGLPFDDYVVTETGAPSGFKLDSSSGVTVTVSHDATCNSNHDAVSTGTAASQSYSDTPKTDITVEAKAQLTGATQSTVTCGTGVSSGNITGTIGDSPKGPLSDAKVTDTGESPGTYYCKIYIDP